jgi:FtsZ-binding cell division protein ZapB
LSELEKCHWFYDESKLATFITLAKILLQEGESALSKGSESVLRKLLTFQLQSLDFLIFAEKNAEQDGSTLLLECLHFLEQHQIFLETIEHLKEEVDELKRKRADQTKEVEVSSKKMLKQDEVFLKIENCNEEWVIRSIQNREAGDGGCNIGREAEEPGAEFQHQQVRGRDSLEPGLFRKTIYGPLDPV